MDILEAVHVVLPSGLAVPDVVVFDSAVTEFDGTRMDAEAVLLAVEVVSPGNRAMGRKVKPLLYAEARIPHFWRLELAPAPVLVLHELEDGGYTERLTALASTTTHPKAPFPLDVDPAVLTQK